MPRKKTQPTQTAAEPATADTGTNIATAEAENPLPPVARPAWVDGPSEPMREGEGPREEPPKHWGDPYKSIFSCKEMGFTLGENRRFRQRVFTFYEKPDEQIITQLKENGFTYRAAEKSWTVTATAETRKVTDELARQWAGPNYVQGVER